LNRRIHVRAVFTLCRVLVEHGDGKIGELLATVREIVAWSTRQRRAPSSCWAG
jgi:hypothetical protein